MSFPFSSFVVTLCFGVGFIFLPSPVQSLPLKAIAQINSYSTPQDFVNEGVKKLQQGDYRKAIADYDEAIRLNRNFTEAISNRQIAQVIRAEVVRTALPYLW